MVPEEAVVTVLQAWGICYLYAVCRHILPAVGLAGCEWECIPPWSGGRQWGMASSSRVLSAGRPAQPFEGVGVKDHRVGQ